MTADLATRPLFGLPLAEFWFALVFFVLGLYLLLDGLDLGVGVLFALRDDETERKTLVATIGPVWEGNAVWLVVFGGVLFAAFPPVYANLFSRYYLLMFAILAALGLRGLAIKLYKERDKERWHRWWGRAFAVGSATAPFFLGTFVGNWVLGAPATLTLPGVLFGLAVVALAVVAGTAFLAFKLQGAFRSEMLQYGPRAILAYLVLVVAALGSLILARPAMQSAVLAPATLGLLALAVVFAGGYVLALRREAYRAVFVLVAGLVFDLVTVVALLLHPAIDPATSLSVGEAIVSTLPLNLMSVAAVILLPLIFLYFVVLYSAFRGPVEMGETY